MLYTLLDGVQRNREHPDTFEIPSNVEKLLIVPGCYVKVGFEQGGQTERMWVEVTRVRGDTIEGRLANEPIGIGIEFGDEVTLEKRHVLNILWER